MYKRKLEFLNLIALFIKRRTNFIIYISHLHDTHTKVPEPHTNISINILK